MLRRLLAGGVTLCALLAIPLVSPAATLLFDYVGFDYESPDPSPGLFGEAGSAYVGLGTVPGLFAPLVADTSLNEYTYIMGPLTPVSRTVIGTYVIVNYGPGTLSIYEDAKSGGTAADYGANPPNPTAPPTFVDGSLFLTGALTGFQFVYNTANGSGSFEGAYTITGGSQLGNFPANQRDGWTFAGSSGNALNIPAGYLHQIDGQNFLNEVVLVRSSSWGRLKASFR